MQSLAAHLKRGAQALGPAVRDEFHVERIIAAVELVADDRQPEPESVGADLVLAARVRLHTCERVAIAHQHGLEERRGGQSAGTFAHGRLHHDLAGLVGAERLIDHHRLLELALEQRVVGLEHHASLHRGLRGGGGVVMLGDEDHAAGLAVEAADEVRDLHLLPFLDRADERGPRAVLRRVADEPARLVEDHVVVVLLDQPLRQLGRIHLRRGAARRDEGIVGHRTGGRRSCQASGNPWPRRRARTSPTR